MEDEITLVIAEDHEEILKHFEWVLSREEGLRVVDVATNGPDAVKSVIQHRPTVFLTDIQMNSHDDGLQAIAEVIRRFPETKCIVLTVHKEDEYIFRAFELGAVDYILKEESAGDIIKAVKMAAKGLLSWNPFITQKILSEYQKIKLQQKHVKELIAIINKLTRSEIQVLAFLAQGNKPRAISQMRHVEATTVRSHISKILKKFNARTIKEVLTEISENNLNDILIEISDITK